ncbi:LacI family DNA-binding transcriptional regulator [Aliamphritea hakodatensis]|uniref:LacI family DNA-binding transcriptional regulator n=1 Tax=Aliamphritea hakodatensis TaxID=2895352 RepID=UPI0022FD6B14|nr:LacI family DNA-binding transcriptional regulator [Aliamphritea hakodatensis]
MSDKDSHNKKVTSVDVARLAGVSRSAVSRTFTPNASVSEETRNKVMQAAQALGYRVNKLASSLINNRSDLVGIIASNMDNPFRSRQVEYLAKTLLANNLRPILLLVEGEEDPSRIIGMLLEYNVSGVIVTSDTPPQSICEECVTLGVPMVLVNKDQTDAMVDRVLLDNPRSGRIAAETLFNSGCRKLAVVTTVKPSYSLSVRVGAFTERCRSLGIETVERFSAPEQSYDGGRHAADLLMAAAEPADGVFCVSDYMAMGFLDQLRIAQKIAVPQQLKVISCDDIPQAGWPVYDLSSIRQDPEQLAELVVEVLLERIHNPELPAAVKVLDVSLTARNSTAK